MRSTEAPVGPRRRRILLVAAALLAALAAAALLQWGPFAGASRPNLVLISLDTTRPDHLGAYGYGPARTPNIDALAKEGFLFLGHMTPVPITLPAHTSLFTGLYPPSHTVRDNGTFVAPQRLLTLAEVLRDAGYATSAFVGSFPLDARFGLDQGFDHYDSGFQTWAERRGPLDRGSRMDVFFDERPASAVVDAALDFHRLQPRKPFFCFLHFFDPHQPLLPPAPYDLEFRQRPYDGEIAFVDEQIGRFFQFLRDRGDWANTLVVVTADHGEGMGEHGELTHAMLLHQATLRIPLILRGPGIPPGGSTKEWTMSTQLFSTLLDLLGLPQPPADSARSHGMTGLLRGAQPSGASGQGFQAYFETISPRTSQGWSQLTAWMQGDWRLVHGPRDELYELASDPREARDRFALQPERAASMLESLRQFLQAHEVGKIADSFQELDPETRQKLESLGYLQANAQDLESVADMLDAGGRIDPRDRVGDVSLYSEAKAALFSGNQALAITLSLELARRNPQHVFAYQSLASLYAQKGDWVRCFESLDTAMQIQPGNTELRLLRGQFLVESDRPSEALETLRSLPEPEKSVNVCIWMGEAYRKLGQPDRSKEWYRKGLAIDPAHRWLRLYLANRLAAEKDHAQAEAMYRALAADFPYFGLALYNYAVLLLERGQPGPARALLERVRRINPGHVATLEALRALPDRSAPP